jgi:hypothetical protein
VSSCVIQVFTKSAKSGDLTLGLLPVIANFFFHFSNLLYINNYWFLSHLQKQQDLWKYGKASWGTETLLKRMLMGGGVGVCFVQNCLQNLQL